MPRQGAGKRALLSDRLQSIAAIDEAAWESLKRDLEPISDSYLRKLLRESGRELAPLVEGVNTHTTDAAERTLIALAAEYESSDAHRRKQCRALVLEAKERLRWSKRPFKDEVFLWVSTWLENPSLFPSWVSLRRRSHPPDY